MKNFFANRTEPLPKQELRISITSACNMACVYCHNEGNCEHSYMTVDDVRAIVEAAKGFGLESVRITGGEPLVSKEIFAICQMLSEEYHLNVGINTNGIKTDTLLELIQAGWISRVVVGLDYFDHTISKNSPIGVPSSVILANVLKIKETGCDVCVDTVYDGDYSNVSRMTDWAIRNRIRLKIIEEVVPGKTGDNPEYDSMRERILNDYDLTPHLDDMRETNGYLGTFRAVSFFHSFCRIGDCKTCQKLPVRITSSMAAKTCILEEEFHPYNTIPA